MIAVPVQAECTTPVIALCRSWSQRKWFVDIMLSTYRGIRKFRSEDEIFAKTFAIR